MWTRWVTSQLNFVVLTDSNNWPTPKTCGTDCGRVIFETELAVLVIGDSCKPQSTEEVLEDSCNAKDLWGDLETFFVMMKRKNNKVEHWIIPDIHKCPHPMNHKVCSMFNVSNPPHQKKGIHQKMLAHWSWPSQVLNLTQTEASLQVWTSQ